ncbi:MAG TPA: hypothetical protein VFT19_10960 [Solirubrobacterales bacterium]|nr:hypothetical protein [Solirubrobacterales bacterium]
MLLTALVALVGAVMASPAAASEARFHTGTETPTIKATATGVQEWLHAGGSMECEVPPSTSEIANEDTELVLPLIDQECDREGYAASVAYNGCALILKPEELAPGKLEGAELGDAPGESCSAAVVTGWPNLKSCETDIPAQSFTGQPYAGGVTYENIEEENVKKVKIDVEVSPVAEGGPHCGGSEFSFPLNAGWVIAAEQEGSPVSISLELEGGWDPPSGATEFEAEFAPYHGFANSLSAANAPGDALVVETYIGSMTCGYDTSGSMAAQVLSSVSARIHDSACSIDVPFSEDDLSAELVGNDCDLKFSVEPEGSPVTGDVDLVCWEENSLEILVDEESTQICRYAVQSQDSSAVSYSNEGDTVIAAVDDVSFSVTRVSGKFLDCGSASQEWGLDEGAFELSAANSLLQAIGFRVG